MSHETNATYHQLEEQNASSPNSRTVLVGRSNGKIQTADYEAYYADQPEKARVSFVDADMGPAHKDVATLALSDDEQYKLAEELAMSIPRSRESLVRDPSKVKSKLASVATATVRPEVGLAPEEVEQKIDVSPEDIIRAESEIEKIAHSSLTTAFTEGFTPSEIREILDPNSGDSEKREAVLLSIKQRIDDLGYRNMLPERIQRNGNATFKSARFGHGVKEMPSREKASLIALSMIDGSFEGDPRKLDYEDLPANHEHNGQHRQAALMVLKSFEEEAKDNSEHEALGKFVDTDPYVEKVIRDFKDSAESHLSIVLNSLRGYENGLPDIFDTNDVHQGLMAAHTRLREIIEQAHDLIQRINWSEQRDAYENRQDLGAVTAISNNLEYANESIMRNARKVEELAYDQNALLEVRSIFTQSMPVLFVEIDATRKMVREITESEYQ